MTEKTDKKSVRVVAIIQARMGSTRLPGKVLMPLLGKPMLSYVVERLKKAELVDEVVVATSERPENDKIREFCQKNRISCFSGSEENVLDRLYKAAKKNHADIVIRITGDCPLIDPQLVEKLVEFFLQQDYDFVSLATGAGVANEDFQGGRFPDGTDTEVFKFEVLETAWKEAKEQMEIEHVTPFIWKRPKRFKLYNYTSDVDYSQMRWVVDNKEDFELIEAIYKDLYPKNPNFGMHDVLDFLKRNPDIMQKNKHFIGSEGYEEFWK